MKDTKYFTLFLPLGISLFLIGDPVYSYLSAWIGSFFLLYLSITGYIKPLPKDLSFIQQIMRPLFLIQTIFCGFNFCSSIFFFLEALGMNEFAWQPNFLVDYEKVKLIATCQRYYLLGHIFLLIGLYYKPIGEKKILYRLTDKVSWDDFLMLLTASAFVVSILMKFIPGMSQITQQMTGLSFFCGTYLLSNSIISKNNTKIWISSLFYGFNFLQNMLAGFKEPLIVSLLLLGIFLYPYYRKLILYLSLPFLYVSFFLIPAYVSTFRQLSGNSDGLNVTEIRDKAIDAALENKESNWAFLVGRLSEIGMFTKYVSTTPEKVPFYNTKIVEQSLLSLLPRIFFPDKPITEILVMQRVFDAGVVNNISKVSAKPMYIVDGYLSLGELGVMISLFIYGFSCQFICDLAERWFGGYTLGTTIFFNGMFQIFWRGLSFEFILNSVLYSLFTMWVIRNILYRYGLLDKIYDDENIAHNTVI